MNATDLVLSRLPGARQVADGKYVCRCPAHKDKSPSLSISRGEHGVLLYCHAGCSIEAILTALDLSASQLFDDVPWSGLPGKPTRPWIGRQVLEGVAHEATVVLLMASNMMGGAVLSEADMDRLTEAQERLEHARGML
jgi:hypothetical protein